MQVPKKKANTKRTKKKAFVVIRKANFNVAVVIKAKNKVIAGDFTRRSKIVQDNMRKSVEQKGDLKQCVLAVGAKSGKNMIVKPEPKEIEIDLPCDLVNKELNSHGIKHRPSKKLNNGLLREIRRYMEYGELPMYVL